MPLFSDWRITERTLGQKVNRAGIQEAKHVVFKILNNVYIRLPVSEFLRHMQFSKIQKKLQKAKLVKWRKKAEIQKLQVCNETNEDGYVSLKHETSHILHYKKGNV